MPLYALPLCLLAFVGTSLACLETLSIGSCSTRIHKLNSSEVAILDDKRACASNDYLTVGAIGSADTCTRNNHMFLLNFLLPADVTDVQTATIELFVKEALDGVRKRDTILLLTLPIMGTPRALTRNQKRSTEHLNIFF